MRDYVITVNSTVDLPKEWLAERGVPVIPLKYTIDGETYTDMEGLSEKEFFAKLREGKMSVTSQVNPEEVVTMFEPYVKEGKERLEKLNPGSDLEKDHTFRMLLKNYVYYAYHHKVNEWEQNYASLILNWQLGTETET